MKLGYFTMPLHPPGHNFTETIHSDLEQIVLLDKLGYEEAWIGEHLTFEWENIPAPDLFIAQALAMTENIILGTGVTCMPNHNPFMLAHRIAQLDHMAKGRFYWGVGSSSTPGDQQLFDFDSKKVDQRALTREAVDLIIELWRNPKPGLYEHPRWRGTVPEPVENIGLRWHLGPYQKAASTHRRGGRVAQLGHSDSCRCAGLDAHECELHSHEHGEGSLGLCGEGRRSRWEDCGPVSVADCARGVRCGHDGAGQAGRDRRSAGAGLHGLLDEPACRRPGPVNPEVGPGHA